MKRKPNILVFFTDQQRADSCGCYGSPNGLTPFLDSLGEDGVVFENAFTCQPVCGPARATIQTGQYATHNGCFRNAINLPVSDKTLIRNLEYQCKHCKEKFNIEIEPRALEPGA